MAAKVVSSQYDGQTVIYIDPLKLQHSGVIVGRSPDGAWFYAQSDNPNVPAAAWHFRVSAQMLPQIITA